MDKKQNPNDVKTDLKHDTMDFSASSDGDDKLDLDNLDPLREEDAISDEELDALEDDSDDDMAAALNAVENDRQADPDNLPEESDEDDYYDNNEDEPAEGELDGRL